MSNESRLPLYREAMSLETKRAVLQKQLDEILKRLAEIHSELSGKSTVTTKPVTTVRASTKRAGRGELQTMVIKAMEAAGEAGVKVNELSKRLGVKAANLYAWFQQAVKRNPAIKKIGAAHYHLNADVVKTAEKAKRVTRKKRRAKK